MDSVALLELARTIALLGVALLAAGYDLRTRRIPNRLTLGGVLAGLALATMGGWSVAGHHLLAALIMLAAGVPLFATGVLGGGDVKLMVAVAALIGPAELPAALLLASAVGAALAVADCARRGILLPVVLNCGGLVVRWVTLGRRGRPLSLSPEAVTTVPYAVAIGAGAVLARIL